MFNPVEKPLNLELAQDLDRGGVQDLSTTRVAGQIVTCEQPHRASLPSEAEGRRGACQPCTDDSDIALTVGHSGPSLDGHAAAALPRSKHRDQIL